MTIIEYLNNLNNHFKRGIATEHTFRADLQHLIESIAPKVQATNEPRRIGCGAPDYVITHKDIPIGYIEAKDIDIDLKSKQYREQFDRYRNALDNLIITDYLTFDFYKEGEFITSVRIGEVCNNSIVSIDDNFDKFLQLIQDFCSYKGQTIRSAKRLAQLMAAKARLLASSLRNALEQDQKQSKTSDLSAQLDAFKKVLIDTITPQEFADIYAQTIAYGMFAARLHDKTLDTFSRMEAASLIPHSNPFLRKMFQKIATFDLDTRIAWIVDALADVFKHTDVSAILKNFGKSTQQNDPIIHFYETFLAEYDPKLRKARGVWYTPEPVVNFIVRAVDDILKQDFAIKDGLASRETIQVEQAIEQSRDKRTKDGTKKELKTYHKVQILDPATGTGTFLSEVIKQIYARFENNKGMWNGYVSQHLIPRLNGFELLMASYAMAHLKMDLLLEETGYKAQNEQRFNIFLTNSLEESHPDMGTLFASWLSDEANAANKVKRDTPVMCVIGNPPYNVDSKNQGEWIMKLMYDYKKEPNTTERLKERNPKAINDDYVKFLRYAQHYVQKNEVGVVAFINPHSYLDNLTFRGMRWNLLKTYDKIYVIDLHGNSQRKEVCPDGSPDDNIFDIRQGVSINILVKTGQKHPNELGKVFHYDLWGKREDKYQYLFDNNITSIPFVQLENRPPMYFMTPINFDLQDKYNKGFSLSDIFLKKSVGVVTSNDEVLVNKSLDNLLKNIENHYKISPDKSFVIKYDYRPFDIEYIYFDDSLIERSRKRIMANFAEKENIGLVLARQSSSESWNNIQVSRHIIDNRFHYSQRGTTSVSPLYLYPASNHPNAFEGDVRRPNLNMEIVEQIEKKLNYCFVEDDNLVVDLAEGCDGTLYPTDLLDYIYAVLHSPQYRETYKEFLKTDFPRVTYPKSAEKFNQLVELGAQIRMLHLMDTKGTSNVTYPKEGSNIVQRSIGKNDFELVNKENKLGRVWINDEQYFDNVPVVAWEFYIGGYQPAQKWLKDRKERELSFDDIEHYQNIIHSLLETDRIMKEIDEVGVL